MAQGGLHRGVAVCGSTPGPPVTQPSPGLVRIPSVPHPLHLVFCTGTSWGGDFVLSNARPGGLDPGLGDGGVQGRRHRGGGKGRHLPLRCSLRRGNDACSLDAWLPRKCFETRGGPPVPGPLPTWELK